MSGLKSRSEREIDMLFIKTETNTGPMGQRQRQIYTLTMEMNKLI